MNITGPGQGRSWCHRVQSNIGSNEHCLTRLGKIERALLNQFASQKLDVKNISHEWSIGMIVYEYHELPKSTIPDTRSKL